MFSLVDTSPAGMMVKAVEKCLLCEPPLRQYRRSLKYTIASLKFAAYDSAFCLLALFQ